MTLKLLEMFDSPVAARTMHEEGNGAAWESSPA